MFRLPLTVSPAPGLRTGALALPLVLASTLVLVACGQSGAQSAGAGGPPPAPQVGVVTVQPGNVGLVTELPGRLEASRIAEVRARVAGILQKRVFKEGSDVKSGQKLFQIDDAPYRAAVAQAQASLAQAEASLAQSRALAERYAQPAWRRAAHWPSAMRFWWHKTPSASRTMTTPWPRAWRVKPMLQPPRRP